MFWRIGYFIRDFWKEHPELQGCNMLDVGSRNINGSVKDFISGYGGFTGTDFIAGKDVDTVIDNHDLLEEFGDGRFDFITCCDTLEHDVNFWKTVENMRAMLKPGGWLLVTTPGINFFKHDFPSDYYRFTEEAYKDFIFKDFKNVHVEEYKDEGSVYANKPNTVLGFGQKP